MRKIETTRYETTKSANYKIGIERRGQRVAFLLDWLREHPDLFSEEEPLSSTHEVVFDEIGHPSLVPSSVDILPNLAACRYVHFFKSFQPRINRNAKFYVQNTKYKICCILYIKYTIRKIRCILYLVFYVQNTPFYVFCT